MKGAIRNAKGHLGAFELTIDDYAVPRPSSRDRFIFDASRSGATSRCDLVLDLSGGAPLFSLSPAPEEKEDTAAEKEDTATEKEGAATEGSDAT